VSIQTGSTLGGAGDAYPSTNNNLYWFGETILLATSYNGPWQ